MPLEFARGRMSVACGGENRAMPRTGQQHFERVVKKFFDAVRRAIVGPKPVPVPVRR